jgi:uncharacterized membrane protein (DUF4010 family)
MEEIVSIISQVEIAIQTLERVLGFSPLLVIPVFMLVSVFKAMFKSEKAHEYRKVVLTSLCFTVSAALVWVTSHKPDDAQHVAKHALLLGGITSMTYQVVKGVLQWAVDKLFARLEASTGIEYKKPEIPL